MDRSTSSIKEVAQWSVMFADDLVICSQNKDVVKEKLGKGGKHWREEEKDLVEAILNISAAKRQPNYIAQI